MEGSQRTVPRGGGYQEQRQAHHPLQEAAHVKGTSTDRTQMYRGVRTQCNSQELCGSELYFCRLPVTASMRYDYPEGPRCHGNKTR